MNQCCGDWLQVQQEHCHDIELQPPACNENGGSKFGNFQWNKIPTTGMN